MMQDNGEHKLIATTFFGLEEVLSRELLGLGARDIEVHKRSVSFTGDKGFIYKANFCLRTALRVLLPLKTFQVENGDELTALTAGIAWDEYFNHDQTFVVNVVMNSKLFANSMYPALKIKDGIADYFRDKTGSRPSVDKDDPEIYIYAHIFENRCTLAIDTSGEPLFKRGYRQEADVAPISEALAAGLVLLSGWERHQSLVDFMCGSGTILIEAAMIAANIPPGMYRKNFAFQHLKDYDDALFEKITSSVIGRIRETEGYLYGCDRMERAIAKAKVNITSANVDDMIKVRVSDFRDFSPPDKKGMVIINPPYGEKLMVKELERLYSSIGDQLKSHYQGYTAWIISAWQGASKSIGLHPSRKITLYNGPLECRFLKYELYEGTRKAKGQQHQQSR